LFSSSLAGAVTPEAGLWAIDSEVDGRPGRGFQIDVQTGTLVLTFYGYDADGSANWYLSAGAITNDEFTGTLGKYANGTTFGGSHVSASALGSAGTVSLTFFDSTHGRITLPGESAKAISRFDFGSSSGSTGSFPVRSGYKAFLTTERHRTFVITGTCSGSGSKSTTPATTAATFEGIQGFSATTTTALTFSNCTPSTSNTTTVSYFDSNLNPLGFSTVGGRYGAYRTSPSIPISGTVGDAGQYGVQVLYTDNTKQVTKGMNIQSYVMEYDSPETAIANLVTTMIDSTGAVFAVEQDRYRVASDGTLTPLSADIQYLTGQKIHLVLTYN
jgi:hypothetical protein